jgi:hypothetical protein
LWLHRSCAGVEPWLQRLLLLLCTCLALLALLLLGWALLLGCRLGHIWLCAWGLVALSLLQPLLYSNLLS